MISESNSNSSAIQAYRDLIALQLSLNFKYLKEVKRIEIWLAAASCNKP